MVVTSDASGSWGCGAWSQDSRLQYKWPDNCNLHISFKELCALVLAAAVWGRGWNGLKVQWRCDNQAAVRVLSTRFCRDAPMMHLLRCLFFYEAHYQFSVVGVHVPGKDNDLADDLSRNRHLSFLSKAPRMDKAPSPVPDQLPTLLLEQGNWMCPRWTRTFITTFAGASPTPPTGHTEPV